MSATDTPRTDLEFANWDESPEVKALGELARQLECELAEARELHNMQLAGISTASIQNTPLSLLDRIPSDNPYWTVAYGDVCRAIDREIKLRDQLTSAKSALVKAREALNEVDENCGYSTNGAEFKCEFCDSQGKEIDQIKHDDGCFQPIIESALTAINEVLKEDEQ